ncbi:MAG: efflux RND transporter periplasmic adaptor subunit [Chitinophagaceae bacterium]
MRKLLNLTFFTTAIFFASCGAKSDSGNNTLAAKKAELENLKKQQASLNDQIVKLQEEIVNLDPSAANAEKAKLVSVDTIKTENFMHYIDLQGKVDAENIAYVTPRNGGGQVKAVYVKQGEHVSNGQLLLKLDDAIVKQQIAQAQTQLNYAKDIYQRRENLWKENIGTQVELISAKNSVDQAQRQIDLLNEQLGFTNVYSNMDGVAEEVTIRVGELFTGNPQMGGYIKLVNTNNLKVTTNVPENYLDKVKEGSNILINFPDINKTIKAKITLSGKLIDPSTRSFYVEAHLPSDKDLHPNQLALVKIQDYSAANSIVIPVNTLQTDEKGKFVMVAATENGKMIARKRAVQIGQTYGDNVEIKSGLQMGDVLITDGFQSLYDGQLITTDVK